MLRKLVLAALLALGLGVRHLPQPSPATAYLRKFAPFARVVGSLEEPEVVPLKIRATPVT